MGRRLGGNLLACIEEQLDVQGPLSRARRESFFNTCQDDNGCPNVPFDVSSLESNTLNMRHSLQLLLALDNKSFPTAPSGNLVIPANNIWRC
ncbi:hypothetical protein EYF80_046814 [Liparis tanakae]|uniref:Uncharacterized protein n=1 Tax=Liparis tanakae TaxID=230148 RepID=A0A4Z2FQB2_9TELE|nr:hypothetical protein EYF80_046814 [Liparis tanakae]